MTAMRAYLVSWRAALRIARRTGLRNRARSLLVLAMIALPVYAGTVIAVTARTEAVPWQTRAQWMMGQADAVMTRSLRPGDNGRFDTDFVPAGARVLQARQWFAVPVTTGPDIDRIGSWAADLADPMLAGRFRTHAGQVPRSADEVAVSARLAEELRVGIGDTVRLGKPVQQRRVVAVVDRPGELSDRFVVTAPQFPIAGGKGQAQLLLDLPGRPDMEEIGRLAADCRCDLAMTTWDALRPVTSAVDPNEFAVVGLIVGFAVAEVVLLAGAAFAVGARRQTRELGLVAAAGGNARHVGQVVLGGGIVLGTVAGMLGAVAGALTVVVGRPVVEQLADHVVDHTVVRVGDLVGIVAIAVAAGLSAAALPARGAARRPVLAALTGRQAQSTGGRRLVLTGLATTAVGALVTAVGAAPPARASLVTAGSILGLVGIVLCAPALVGLVARIAGRLPLSPRLALRDAARHRHRTGAAMAAVTAAVAGSMALNLYLASQDDADQRQPTQIRIGQAWIAGDPDEVGRLSESDVASVADALPVRDTVALRTALAHTDDGPPARLWAQTDRPDAFGEVAIGDVRVVRAVVGRAVPAEVVRTLEDGGAVVVQPGVSVHDGRVSIAVFGNDVSAGRDLPAVVFGAQRGYGSLPAVIVGERGAQRLGLDPAHAVPESILFDTTRTPTRAEELAAVDAFEDLEDRLGVPGTAAVSVQRAYSSDLAVALLVLIGISGLVTLMATGIAVGLAVAESRDDLSTLAAVGAPPRVRRMLSMGQAGLIAGLGTLLGVAAGILPAAGVIGVREDLRWVVPWRHLVLFAVVPALAMLLCGAVTRSRLTLVRRWS